MSQLTIQLSDKADALLAQLQKEIFQRRRKKVSPEGVIETLLESGAKSQSDKRFATSWKNLVSDIEKAARLADAHGTKPAVLSDEEWALVLAHRDRAPQTSPLPRSAAAKRRASGSTKTIPSAETGARKGAATARTRTTKAAAKPQPARLGVVPPNDAKAIEGLRRKRATAATVAKGKTRKAGSVEKRMAKAAGRLSPGEMVALEPANAFTENGGVGAKLP